MDCDCSDCSNSAACGGPGPTPTPPPPPAPSPASSCTGSSAGLPANQCAAWIDFYDATAGATWLKCADTRTDPCACKGWQDSTATCANIVSRRERIAAAKEGRAATTSWTIEKIELYACNLKGSLPESILAFEDLASFDVSSNALGGTIPMGVTGWATLRSFDIGNCNFVGGLPRYHLTPSFPTYWHSIEFFYIDGNSFSGAPLPALPFENTRIDRCHLLSAASTNSFLCPWPANVVESCGKQEPGATDWVPITEADCVSGPAPAPTPKPPTPPPTPPVLPTTCDDCQAEGKLWCQQDGTCKAEIEKSGCSFFDAVCNNKSWCYCTDCNDAKCIPGAPTPAPPGPTPSPPPTPPLPTTCAECVAQDNKEWCWDPKPGSFAAAVGADADVGYCLTPGDGCTESRATCKMAIDCRCSDCNDSGVCGGPGPVPTPPPTPGTPPPTPTSRQWIGVADMYDYEPNTDCDLEKRTPMTPIGSVVSITRLAEDINSQCNHETMKPVGAGVSDVVKNYWRYTCQENSGSITVVKTMCYDMDCSNCGTDDVVYSVGYNAFGACLSGGGLGSQNSREMDPPRETQAGKISHALAHCLVPPMMPPTPPPTPRALKSDAVPIGVGLGIGLPAVAGGLWFAHRRRQANAGDVAQQGNRELLANTGDGGGAVGGGLGEMYSQL